MSDTSTDAVEQLARALNALAFDACVEGWQDAAVDIGLSRDALRSLAAERDALRAALAEIKRQFGNTPGGHMAATIADAALNAERKNHG